MNFTWRPRWEKLSRFPTAILLALMLGGCGGHEPAAQPAASGAKKGTGSPPATAQWPTDFNPPVDIRTEPVKVPEQIRGSSPPIDGAKGK